MEKFSELQPFLLGGVIVDRKSRFERIEYLLEMLERLVGLIRVELKK